MQYSSEQRSVISNTGYAAQVVAAAGSGKTRTMIGLIEDRVSGGRFRADRILVLSFSRKAAGELKGRLALALQKKVEVSTFHSFCFRHLKNAGLLTGSFIHPGKKEQFYFDRLRKAGKATLGIPYEMLLRYPSLFRKLLPELSMQVHHAFYSWKRQLNGFEFADLCGLMISLLRDGSELARRYDCIVVDEFQDTDPLQLSFLKLMVCKELVVVGDDYQSIYAFRGATVKPFLDFRLEFPGALQYRLSQNYRSVPEIIKASSTIISLSSRQIKKSVRAVRKKQKTGAVATYLAADPKELIAILRVADAMVLVRSNYRRLYWEKSGCPPEKVSTIHRVKGLEFNAVFLDFAGGWNKSPDHPDEEIRIAYVGASRARDFLLLLLNPDAASETMEGKMLQLFVDRYSTLSSARLRQKVLTADTAHVSK